ncbi:MAG: DNA polymerase III subunit delta' [Ruminococcus sp.]|nr:DNA polymerase III subunit delta' [Ruminococcus sp.]
MKKIYGNDYLLSTLKNMVSRDKAAHAVMFYGEKGSGKKLLARYYTMLLLCENLTDGEPCGCCTSCRNVEAGFHPDVIYPEKSGKLGGYSVETVGSVASDAYVKPNNKTGRKVYIFADCRNFDSRPQNKLLKLIEEPPDYAYFIFTAESKSVFLPTIISRCVCFGTSVCTEEQSMQALTEAGYSQEEINSAVKCFHGNIGMCMSYLFDESIRRKVDLTKSLADSIIRRDEYAMNSAFYTVAKDRNDVNDVFSMLDKLIRDAVVLKKIPDTSGISCFADGAGKLSERLDIYQAARLHRYLEKAKSAVESNVSIPLVLAALCAEIIGTV